MGIHFIFSEEMVTRLRDSLRARLTEAGYDTEPREGDLPQPVLVSLLEAFAHHCRDLAAPMLRYFAVGSASGTWHQVATHPRDLAAESAVEAGGAGREEDGRRGACRQFVPQL